MNYNLGNASIKHKYIINAIKQQHISLCGYSDLSDPTDPLTSWEISQSNIGLFRFIKYGEEIIGFVYTNLSNLDFPFFEIYLHPQRVTEKMYSTILRLLFEDIIDGIQIVRIGCYHEDINAICVCEKLDSKDIVETDTHVVFEFYPPFPTDDTFDMSEFDKMLGDENKAMFCRNILL